MFQIPLCFSGSLRNDFLFSSFSYSLHLKCWNNHHFLKSVPQPDVASNMCKMAPILMIPEKSICVVRNVTSRHLNLFGFYSPNSSPGNSQLHNPCLGICSNAILHGVVMDLHSARCSGYFRRGQYRKIHPFLFPKIVPGLFPESKNSHLKPAIFSHPISFGFLLVRKDQGVNTPAAWGLYSSNLAARCTTLEVVAGWKGGLGHPDLRCDGYFLLKKNGGQFSSHCYVNLTFFAVFRCVFKSMISP